MQVSTKCDFRWIFQKEKNFKIDAMNVKTMRQWEVLWKMGAFFLACGSSTCPDYWLGLKTQSLFKNLTAMWPEYVNCQLSIVRMSILSILSQPRGGIDLNTAFLSSPLETSTLITKQLAKLRKWGRRHKKHTLKMDPKLNQQRWNVVFERLIQFKILKKEVTFFCGVS